MRFIAFSPHVIPHSKMHVPRTPFPVLFDKIDGELKGHART